MEQPLTGQTALVTGASSGIGYAIAEHLAAAGARVCINYHSSQEPAEKLRDQIEASGGQAMVFQANVGEEADVERMFAAVDERFGPLHILVNNAGVQKDAPLLEMSLDDWELAIRTDLTGAFLCARAAARRFKAQKESGAENPSRAVGKILFITSVHDTIPWAGHANYAAAKGGCLMLMRSLAQELGHLGIRVNSLGPGAIKTPINQEVWQDEAKRQKLLELVPYGRIGETPDVGQAAVWLLSDQSDYVHGATLYLDGGMTTYPGFIGNG